jgi:pSer/pThr/pTyr-binding forkhead associated (FHA) protein
MELVVLEMPGQIPGVPQSNSFTLEPNPAQPILSIGRQAGNDIILADSSVSRRHVEVQVRPEGLVIRDLGSANGTFLNNDQLQPQVQVLVRPGDRLRIGNVLTQLRTITTELPTTALTPNDSATVGGAYATPTQAGYPSSQNPNQAYQNNPAVGYTPTQNQKQNPQYQNPQYSNNNAAYGAPVPPPATNANYNPADYPNAYSPNYTPLPLQSRQTSPDAAYVPNRYGDPYAAQYQQGQSQPVYTGSDQNQSQDSRRSSVSPLLWIIPLCILAIVVLAVGGFLLLSSVNKNVSSFTTIDQLNLPVSPASANSISNILGVTVPTFTAWQRRDDPKGNRVVFSKQGQPSTALTIEKPPSVTLVNGSLSAEAAVRQYLANVQANAQNVQINIPPTQVKLTDGSLAWLTSVQFSVPNVVTDYRLNALAVQCNGSLYFVSSAAETKSTDVNTDTDLKAAIANTRCK